MMLSWDGSGKVQQGNICFTKELFFYLLNKTKMMSCKLISTPIDQITN